MSDEPLLPCLKEPAWSGRDAVVSRPLWRESSPYVPWVALGYERAGTIEFLGRDRAANRDAGELEREALANLRRREASWQELRLELGGFKNLRMLAAADDVLAAERILDPAFLEEAQRQLRAPGLFVGIPRRAFLVVTAFDTIVERCHAFGAVVATQFQGAESDPITPLLFTAKNGRLVGTVDVVARAIVPPESMSGEPAAGA